MTALHPELKRIQDELNATKGELRMAERAEKRAKRQFADDKISYDELRLAIRRVAVAEKRIEDLIVIEVNMRNIYAQR